MLRLEGGQSLDGVLPLWEGLVGQAIHQVEVDVVEPGGAGGPVGFDRAVGGVAAAQELQQTVVKGLHTDAQTVDALAQQALAGGSVKVAGVGFDGDFGPGVDGE